jgi:hypothetical protein
MAATSLSLYSLRNDNKPPITRSKLKQAFPFSEKYDQIKETPLKHRISQSELKPLNFL